MDFLSEAVSEVNREFKKLQRQLQGKRHIKIELCVKLSLLRLFHVDHVIQNRRSALSLVWHVWFSCKGEEWKIYCCELQLSSEPQIWKFHVVVKTLHQKACRTCSTIIFLHSTNEISDLWRCRWRCRRQVLNSIRLHSKLSFERRGNDWIMDTCVVQFTLQKQDLMPVLTITLLP